MKRIAVHLGKGGVGKTTSALNIAGAFLSEGYSVLILDGDPQGNLTSALLENVPAHEWVEILKDEFPIKETIQSITPKLGLLPTKKIGTQLRKWANNELPENHFAMSDFFESLNGTGFDYLIVDLGPGVNTLEREIIACMDEIIGITIPELFGVDGFALYATELLDIKKKYKAKFVADKIVINRLNKSFSIHSIYDEQLKEFKGYKFFTIGQSVKLSEAPIYHQPIQAYMPKHESIDEYKKIMKALR
jgi:chromosome partitioning protein